MILDTSAIVAILIQEPGSERVEAALARAVAVGIGAPTLTETGIVLSARLRMDARALLARFLSKARVTVIPFEERHYDAALSAWLRFGRGRHPAALNFGDCQSFAIARLAGRPLLCVGDDFPRTDLELVAL